MPKITLSFDDGPEPGCTEVVLDTLLKHNIKTSFFVIGQKLEDAARRKLAERAVAEGHWLGSHSYHDKTPLGWLEDRAEAIREIDLSTRAIGDLATPELMYRPFGAGGVTDTRLLNELAVDHLCRVGYTCVLWNYTPQEWKYPEIWVDRVLAATRERDWTVVSLRDCEPAIVRHIDELCTRLSNAEVEIVQDFPVEMKPIVRGVQVLPVHSYVSG